MSLKQEIETWVQALSHYDQTEYEESLRVFDNIADTSRILFNCGVIHATIGEHEKAVECYQRAIKLDQYLAVAYFQQGVSNFLLGDFEEALANFNDTLLYLRGNTYIDYDQLGLKFKLYSCEVLFNRGLCYIYLQQEEPGLQDFGYARKEKMTPDHDVIDDAIKEKAEGYTVFSIPVGVVYRPNEAKVKNLKTKDYLGKARLVATADSANTGVGFAGAERAQALQKADAAKDDRPAENISYAATNLVQRSLTSRVARESSAPPVMGRNVFPPTPPPEAEKPRSGSRNSGGAPSNQNNLPMRSASMRNPPSNMMPPPPRGQGEPRPGMLSRSQTFDNNGGYARRSGEPNMPSPRASYGEPQYMERPRMGTVRGASEPRGARQPYPSRSMSTRAPAPAPLFREQPRARFERDQTHDTVDDVYGLYAQSRSRDIYGGPRGSQAQGSPYMLDEVDEDDYVDDTEVGPEDMAGFEPVFNNRSPPQSRMQPAMSVRQKRVEMRKIRCKVHANEDTRYIIMQADGLVDFGEFESKIREKFAVKSALKIKMRDIEDGDMITMGDQDDLDMLLQHVRSQAKMEKSEMGKMEVWIKY
ncbi:uncharacterized protein HMPREF1541_02558 [Cyphellophora europaea CBS 101466]|uniref:PB1 domain-containing protein n=1 Tax=Cyphellophora europaea (strain CBS 101466) TaxID=1220924 RepID=W2S661_CYPE1|nr:uncharacterized protein HMPREF1541_02558 [Cyphellophora europaea CBS 101466]ETN43399.1 hypothetical protein HMPREF1541_02558 [Cyphellophora europaea CBS 101466]